MTRLHASAWSKLAEAHRYRKAALARDLQKKINQAKADTREEYRPKWRELRKVQKSEQATYAELEKSFFGRAANAAKLSADMVREQRGGIIARSFQIISNASARKEYFEKAQDRARNALQREQADRLQSLAKELKTSQERKYADNRAVFMAEREKLDQKHQNDRDQLKDAWKERNAEKRQALDGMKSQAELKSKLRKPSVDLGHVQLTDEYYEKLKARLKLTDSYGQSQKPSQEQDNAQDRDDGQER